MSDPDAPQERPHYWDECEAMSFGQLREFVDRALDAIRNGDSEDGQPSTKPEFVALADMLDAKIAESWDEVPPFRPCRSPRPAMIRTYPPTPAENSTGPANSTI
jgi:hypothetical protein